MNKNIIFFGLLITLGVIAISGCDKDCDDPFNPMCPNYDPCIDAPVPDASFVVLDSILSGWADTTMSFVSDTFNMGATVYFRALSNNIATYEWKVGTDARTFTGKEFNLGFDGYEGDVTIRCVTTLNYNGDCLTEEELKDTTYQTITIVDGGFYGSQVYGEYIGTDTTDPSKEYTLTLIKEGEDLWHSQRLFGVNNQCDYPIGLRFGAGYKWFASIHDDIWCRETVVIGRLQEDNNTLVVDCYYDDDDGKRQHYVFTGVRQ